MFVSRAVQKVVLVVCYWWFSIPIFLWSEKPSPMKQTCTSLFHKMSFIFIVCIVHKLKYKIKGTVSVYENGKIEDFLYKKKPARCWRVNLWLFHASVWRLSFAVSSRHLIDRKTINIPESLSGVHSFTGKTVTLIFNEAVHQSIT